MVLVAANRGTESGPLTRTLLVPIEPKRLGLQPGHYEMVVSGFGMEPEVVGCAGGPRYLLVRLPACATAAIEVVPVSACAP